LDCHNNLLSELDVSKNTLLEHLYCDANQLGVAALDGVFTALPDRSGKPAGYMRVKDNPGQETCNRNMAAAKNWNVSQ
jgi:hypothetical protein